MSWQFDHMGRPVRLTAPSLYTPPLLTLANRIPPRYRQYFVGVTLDSRLGFTGRHQFHYLAQAIRWMESPVGVEWAIKGRTAPPTLDDLLQCTSRTIPDTIITQIRRYLPIR